MKKLLFSALALTLVFAIASWATDTRVLTLGQANQIVKDEANIFLYPSTLNMYKGLALAEVMPNDLYRLGIHYDFGEGKGIVGVYLDKTPTLLLPGQVNPANSVAGGVDNRLKLFYARPFGGMDFGMLLDLYHDSYKVDGDTTDLTEQANTGIGLQVGLTLMEKLEVAAKIELMSWTRKNGNGQEVTKPTSNMRITVDGRYWHGFTDEVDFVPHLEFVYATGGYDQQGYDVNNVWTTTQKNTGSDMVLDLGWGVNIRPEERILVLFDLGIYYNPSTEKTEPVPATTQNPTVEEKYTHMYFPYFKVGLEGHVTKWWDLRLGAVKKWYGQSDDYQNQTYPTIIGTKKYGYDQTTTYLGSGIHFGNLYLDVQVDPNFVLKGPNFVSAYDGQLATQASIKYTWK